MDQKKLYFGSKLNFPIRHRQKPVKTQGFVPHTNSPLRKTCKNTGFSTVHERIDVQNPMKTQVFATLRCAAITPLSQSKPKKKRTASGAESFF